MKETRRTRLNELLDGRRFNGDRAAFCRAANITKGRLTQLLDPREAFGDVAARNLCEALGLSHGWFDSSDEKQKEVDQQTPQINERRASYRVVSLEAAVEGLARHFESMDGYDKATAISLLSTLANSPDMHAVVAAGLKTLKPQVRGSPSKQGTPAQTPHDSRAA